jgi:hypothetical protein
MSRQQQLLVLLVLLLALQMQCHMGSERAEHAATVQTF